MKKLQVRLINDSKTDIIVDNGIFKQLSSLLDSISEHTNFVIITDKNVYHHHEKLIKQQFQNYQYNIIVCPDGEKAKSFDNLEKIYSDLIKFSCDRSSYLVAFGGGMIGDITGFIAATFMRGIRYINIPTTLLSMVDSSIGGKTGINLPHGKNLVGSIYHPEKIIIDPELLRTLPTREYHSGMAEVIKYGLILDEKLFIKLENYMAELISTSENSKCLNDIIMNCIELKIKIVKQDERDSGIRNILNFGHTIGHALESFLGYDYIRHGEAVAYGMLYASKLSNSYSNLTEEDLDRINNLIRQLKLPELNNIKTDQILDFIKNDKKKTAKGLNFILLNNIGSANISQNINYNDIKAVLDYEYISY